MKDVWKKCTYMYKKIWGFSKWRIILITFLALADGINIFLTTYFYKYIIDAILQQRSFSYIIVLITIRVGVLLLYQCIDNIFHNIIFPQQDNKIKQGITMELYCKILNIDMINYENSDIYDKISRAINEAENRAMWMLQTLRGLASSTAQLVVLLVSLAFLSPFSIVIAVVGAAITFWANIVNGRKVYCYDKEKTTINRKFDYIRRVFSLPQYASDIHMTNLKDIIERKYDKNIKEMNGIVKKHAPSIAIIAVSASWFFNFLNIGISSLFVSKKIYQGAMTVGDFSSVIAAITSLSNSMLQYSNIIPEFKNHALFIENYLEMMNLPSEIYNEERKEKVKEIQKIHLENITFAYPNSESVLRGINLTINRGQKIALVGENGAGKTTLLKIVLGLYMPMTGKMFINDKLVTSMDMREYYKHFAIVLQDFQIYAMSIKENICMCSDELQVNFDRLQRAIVQSGLSEKIASLEKGIDTPLTTEFENEGVNFSGGERQKLAIARALYSSADVIIMDEPSSSLDPIAEQELFDVIDNISMNKTVIIISHKMSCVKNMDIIYYLEDGYIIEEGSHNELLEKNKKYAKSFKLQADRYVSLDNWQ